MGKKGEIPEILTKVEKEISTRRKRDRKKKATFRDLLHDLKIKKFHKRKVDGLKKLSTRSRLFYDLLHFRGCPFTKSQFSQGAINRIHFNQLFWHCHIYQEAWESKLENAYLKKILSENSHSVTRGQFWTRNDGYKISMFEYVKCSLT